MPWYKWLASKCPFKVLHDRDKLEDPYLIRYTVFKTKLVSLYLHKIIRSDSTRDYHDHPWPFAHIILEGGYWEETPIRTRLKFPGAIAFRRANYSHRLELLTDIKHHNLTGQIKELETWTLVLIGPKQREWGFIGRMTGCWVKWDNYVFNKERCE